MDDFTITADEAQLCTRNEFNTELREMIKKWNGYIEGAILERKGYDQVIFTKFGSDDVIRIVIYKLQLRGFDVDIRYNHEKNVDDIIISW